MGRKPAENPKDELVQIRQTTDEKVRWQAAARSEGLKLTAFIRKAVDRYIASKKKLRK